jgi:hypothetical protein
MDSTEYEMTDTVTTPPPPPLPEVGEEEWGPKLNDCMVYLYEWVTTNNALIQRNTQDIIDVKGMVEAQNAQIANLQGQILTTQGQITALQGQVAALEAVGDKPEYIYSSTSYQFSNQAPPPTGNQVRLDNSDPTKATVICFRLIDVDGADRTRWFTTLTIGSSIRISDWDNSLATHRFRVTGPATIGSSDAQIPVEWDEGSGVIPNAKADVGFLIVV